MVETCGRSLKIMVADMSKFPTDESLNRIFRISPRIEREMNCGGSLSNFFRGVVVIRNETGSAQPIKNFS